jgi:hypothetical protein
MAELIKVALCKISVGGAVTRIFRLIAMMSIFCRVSHSVIFMSGPSSRPRWQLSGVNPSFCNAWIRFGEHLTHSIADFRVLMLRPLTPVYSIYTVKILRTPCCTQVTKTKDSYLYQKSSSAETRWCAMDGVTAREHNVLDTEYVGNDLFCG